MLAELSSHEVSLPTRPGVTVVEVLGFEDAMRLCQVLHIHTEREIDAILSPGALAPGTPLSLARGHRRSRSRNPRQREA
jgi:hypothetical protein